MENQIISGLNSFLIFQLGSDKFAVNIGYVRKIHEMTHITKVPHAPELYLGVINFFGDILPVIDGRVKFALKRKEFSKNTCIIILMVPLETGIYNIGIVVDQVTQVADIDDGDMNDTPDLGKRFQFECISGIAKLKDEFVLVLNVEKLFSEKDLTAINTNN